MTLCSKIRRVAQTSLGAVFFLTNSANAVETLFDAFGSVPLHLADQERLNWSGARIEGRNTLVRKANIPQHLELFAGPKSLVAGSETGQVATIAFDQHGNLMEDNTEATIYFDQQASFARSIYGIASTSVLAPTEAGRYAVSAQINGRQSARRDVRVIADVESVYPRLGSGQRLVEFEALHEVSSEPLMDRFGNSPPDGTFSSISLVHADGATTLLPAPIIDERARAKFLPRDIAGSGQILLRVGPAQSESSDLGIIPLLKTSPTSIELSVAAQLGSLFVRVGPFETDAGYHLPDGALISLRVESASGRAWSEDGWLKDGKAERLVPLDASDAPFTIQVSTALGIETFQLEPKGNELRRKRERK